MTSLARSDVDAAAHRIRGRVRTTPVLQVEPDVLGPGMWVKLEQTQLTGSFKARGAFNRVLSALEQGLVDPTVGVVAASGGNAGLAHAHAARTLGLPATVFVPVTAPRVKVARLRDLGAEVVQAGAEYAESYLAAVAHAEAVGAVFCHAYDQPEMAAGAGTLAVELIDQVGPVDTVVVAVGGGGLVAGVAAALEGEAQVVGVETRGAPTLAAALAAGAPVDVEVGGVAADSLGARRIGELAFDVVRRVGVRSVLVEDAAVVAARRRLWDELRLVVEHGAATAAAAVLTGAYRPEPGERVAVVLCGANTDPSDLVVS